MILNDLVWKSPKITEIPDMDDGNVKAIYFDGLPYKDISITRVFAYIGFPDGASEDNKVPGVVLVHGGGGTAFSCWVKIWNKRGYAAIAMDTEGRQPTRPGTVDNPDNIIPVEHKSGGPLNERHANISEPITDQWMYHAVSDIFLSYSILSADERVDNTKIGITGISWGGVLTGVAIGSANVFAFAVPVYCGAYLQNSKACLGPIYKKPEVIKTWEASNWLHNIKTPTLWLGSDTDTAASIDTVSLTKQNTPGSILTILPGYTHNHEYGMRPKEIYVFADSIVKNEKRLGQITHQWTPQENYVCYELPVGMVPTEAILYYLTDDIEYEADSTTIKNQWESKDLIYDYEKIYIELPSNARIFYVNLKVDGIYTISSDVYKIC